MAETLTPNALARDLSKSLKRPITPKGVRTVARDVLARFDKTKHPEYQAHSYSAAEARTLREAFAKRGSRVVVAPKRAKSAKSTPKAKSTPNATVAS